jgi:hypothetical protein
MRNKGALIVGLICALGASDAHACHRFARWHYPWPQQCGTRAYRPVVYKRIYEGPPPAIFPPVRDIDMPLPDMEFVACPEASDEERGRILLRAALTGEADVR